MATAARTKSTPGPKPKAKPPAAPKARKHTPVETAAAKKKAGQEKRFAKLHEVAIRGGNTMQQAIKSNKRTLTEMQQMFVKHWAAGESILSASARAGYSDNGTYAYRLSKDPLIQEIYQREKKLYEQSCQMTRKKVMDGFIAAAEMAQIQADPTAMTGAFREIGKMCGYYEPKKVEVNHTVNGVITTKVERMSDDMLLKLIKGELDETVFDQDMPEVEETPFKEIA